MIKTLTNLFKQDKEKFVVPKGVQDVIPIKAIYDDGIFLVGKDKFAKSFKFSDINYAVASREDKEAMFLEYSELLNSFDSGATTKITINNRRLNRLDFERNYKMDYAGDFLDVYREEKNGIMLENATGANAIVQDKYVTISVNKKSIEEAIIILPRSLFYTTDISVTLWILNKNKKARVVEQNGQLKRYRNREKEILFMDLRQMGSPYEKKYIELTEEDRAKVTSVYHAWQQEGYEETYQDVPEFCYSASFEEVEQKGFTLVPSRYIEFVNRDENIDFDTKMKTLQGELKELLVAEEKSKADLLAVFKELGYEINL